MKKQETDDLNTQQVEPPKQPKKKKNKKHTKAKPITSDGVASTKPMLKVMAMRSIEMLLLGSAKSGKTTLATSLLCLEQSIQHPQVGLTIYKKEHELRTGETIRLCVHDPATSTLPKEQEVKKDHEEVAQKNGFWHRLVQGDNWWEAFTGSKDDDAVLPYID